jgi:hypothetical protein
MKPLPSLCVLLLLVGFAPVSLAQTMPAWKLKEGDTFYVKQTRKSEQKLIVQDSVIRHELKSTTLSHFKVLPHTDGLLVLQQKIESLSSSGEGNKAKVKDILDALSGATFTFHLDKDFHITKMDGYEALVQKLAKGDAGLATTVRTLLPEAEFRDAVEQLFDFVPSKPVEKGATWDSDTTEPFGPLGVFKISNRWTFAGEGAEPDTVRITGTQKILLDTAQAGKSLPFKIKAGILKKTDAKLDVLFDLARGRLQKRTLNRQLKMQYLIEKDKRVLDMLIEQNTSVTLEVLDKKPAPK